MRRACVTLCLVVSMSAALLVNAQQPAGAGAINTLTASEASSGWVLLFDGKTLSNWVPSGEADWKIEDGTITATKGSGFLATPKPYTDFEFKADFWADKTANSGVFIRCADNPIRAAGCYEVNIFDAHEQWPTGSINNLKTVLPDRPNTTDRWNTFEIIAKGTNLIVRVNGTTTVDVKDDRRPNGTIALQQGGGGAVGLVRFRNVKVRSL